MTVVELETTDVDGHAYNKLTGPLLSMAKHSSVASVSPELLVESSCLDAVDVLCDFVLPFWFSKRSRSQAERKFPASPPESVPLAAWWVKAGPTLGVANEVSTWS